MLYFVHVTEHCYVEGLDYTSAIEYSSNIYRGLEFIPGITQTHTHDFQITLGLPFVVHSYQFFFLEGHFVCVPISRVT